MEASPPSTALTIPDASATLFELDQRRAKAYSESGYWPDAASIAKALVKIEAGRSLNLPPIVAMSEIHVIDGKPSLGAGALAALVKSSGRYDYRVIHLDGTRCVLRFFDRGQALDPVSEFTIDDARVAGLLNKGPWKQYPRNMLFARAMSNGVAWHCPDVTSGRVYVPEELGGDPAVDDVPWPTDEVEEAEYEFTPPAKAQTENEARLEAELQKHADKVEEPDD